MGLCPLLTASACRAGPALDLAFLLDEVMQTAKPLDWAAVLASPVPLKVVASCLDTLQPIILEDFKSAADLSTCLRASANVPEARRPRSDESMCLSPPYLLLRPGACCPQMAMCLCQVLVSFCQIGRVARGLLTRHLAMAACHIRSLTGTW